jgi:hypothetical protein
MKRLLISVSALTVSLNSFSQMNIQWGNTLKDAIQGASRSIHERIVDEGRLLADDKRRECSSTTNELRDRLVETNVALTSFGGSNASFVGFNLFPNSACQDWVKIAAWSNNKKEDEIKQQNNKIDDLNNASELLKSQGISPMQLQLLKQTMQMRSMLPQGGNNPFSDKSEKYNSFNASCLYNSGGDMNISCNSYIDLNSIRKGEKGIDYVFYSMWDYDKPVKGKPDKDTNFKIKVDYNNPLMIKSIRNIVGVSCSNKKYILIGWMANLDSMGFGLRVSEGTYTSVAAGLMNTTVNENFDVSLDRKQLHISAKLSEEFDKFSINDQKSSNVIEVLCSGKNKDELRNGLINISN